MRRIMPYLLRTRAESLVYQESAFDIARTRAWLKAYRRAHAVRATLFHLLAYTCSQVLHARPELNRFVSGGRLYQRRGVQIAFMVKREMSDGGVDVAVKIEVPPALPFADFVALMDGAIEAARNGDRAVDREVALVTRIPGFALRALVALARALDACNLYPRFMTANDPMFASLFLANFGSVGVRDAYHHLYEYGTVSIFGAISAPRRMPSVQGDAVKVKDMLAIRWTFDERVHDAYYGGRSLALAQGVIEDPARHLGAPEGRPVFVSPESVPIATPVGGERTTATPPDA